MNIEVTDEDLALIDGLFGKVQRGAALPDQLEQLKAAATSQMAEVEPAARLRLAMAVGYVGQWLMVNGGMHERMALRAAAGLATDVGRRLA